LIALKYLANSKLHIISYFTFYCKWEKNFTNIIINHHHLALQATSNISQIIMEKQKVSGKRFKTPTVLCLLLLYEEISECHITTHYLRYCTVPQPCIHEVYQPSAVSQCLKISKIKCIKKNPTKSNAKELKRQYDIQFSQFCQHGKRSFFALGISINSYFLRESGTRKQRKIEHLSKNTIINEYRIH